MNLLLTFICVILCFSALVLVEKIFKKEGVYCWMIFATIIANIIVCKNINIGGIVFTLGNVLFASNFLATDILNEKYGVKESKKGVIMALIFAIIFVITMQLALLFVPDTSDLANESMKTLFTLNLRTTLASISMFFISNIANIHLFEYLKKKYLNKLWLRNNISTISTNCLENFAFSFIAFLGIYNISLIFEIAITTCLIEAIIGLLDTPFIYLSKKLK